MRTRSFQRFRNRPLVVSAPELKCRWLGILRAARSGRHVYIRHEGEFCVFLGVAEWERLSALGVVRAIGRKFHRRETDALERYRQRDPDLSISVEKVIEREIDLTGHDPNEGILLPEGQRAPSKPSFESAPSETSATPEQQRLRDILNSNR